MDRKLTAYIPDDVTRDMEKFIYLKLGTGNCLAEYWLRSIGRSILPNRSAVAIYFGDIKTEEIRELLTMPKEERAQRLKSEGRKIDFNAIREFFEAERNAEKTKFVTVSRGIVYIYEPEIDQPIFDMPKDKYEDYDSDLSKLSENHPKWLRSRIEGQKVRPEESKGKNKSIPKIMYVKIVKKLEVKDPKVPHVLVTLPCSRYYTQGTCREITDWGAIQAIKHCLGQQIDVQSINRSPQKLLSLLSPYELETLVFLILRNSQLFVPAWRGGTLKDIDIIGCNLKDSQIEIPPLIFKPGESLTFQVKRKVKTPSRLAHYTIATQYYEKNEKILTAEWLLEQITKQPDTQKWLENSLRWVPNINSLIFNIS